MALTIGQVQAAATKAINERVVDAIWLENLFLEKLKAKEKQWAGERMSFMVNYFDDDDTTGSFYSGSAALDNTEYDPYTEHVHELIEQQETMKIAHRDIARASGKQAKINLLERRLKDFKKAMAQRMNRAIMSDGTASAGADSKTLNGFQIAGLPAFLIASGTYGGLSSSDVAGHAAYISSNSGTDRALTTTLHQLVLGGATEGNIKPGLALCRQNVFNEITELLKAYQVTMKESSISGLGHSGELVYNGVSHIIDNLAPAQTLSFLNMDHVNLYSHPDYNMVQSDWDKLENSDCLQHRLRWKGNFICDTLRFQGQIKDIQVV